MKKHGWIITEVNTEFLDKAEIGTSGPRNMTASDSEIKADGKQFRMLDDDNIEYYRGYCLGDLFAPLDHFGKPNAGCVTIQYRDSVGIWKTL